MFAYLDTTDSPAGPVSFAVDERGVLFRASFLEGDYPLSIEEELARDGFEVSRDKAITAHVRRQIDEYARGERFAFDLPVAPKGTEWQQRVWRALVDIPFGETRSYGEIASTVCTIRAARAVGRANATNPVPLVVPCHRVIGADGSLTGFGGGLHLKTRLLAHEARVLGYEPVAVRQATLRLASEPIADS